MIFSLCIRKDIPLCTLMLLIHKPEEMSVLILDVGLLVGHLPLQQQIPQVPMLQKPSIEVPEHALATHYPSWLPRH
jgi:hypothetical protein